MCGYICVAGVIGPGIKYKGLESSSMDLNSIKSQSTYLVYGTCPNTPDGMGDYGWVTTIPSFGDNYGSQFLLSSRNFFYRTKNNGVWTSWNKITSTYV